VVNAGLADALTGGHDGAAMLDELAASHLFVLAIGRPGRWYRMHRLIVDILRAKPMPTRERRDLHRRAAEWFRDHGMPLDAVRSAVHGGIWGLTADLVGTNLPQFSLRGDARELERYSQACRARCSKPERSLPLVLPLRAQSRGSGTRSTGSLVLPVLAPTSSPDGAPTEFGCCST
jgi:hypothetical protein